EAIVESLVEKSILAARERGARRLYLAGGVASNGRLRELMKERLAANDVAVSWPRPEYCTDNAAMIACAAFYHIGAGLIDGLKLNSFARGNLVNWAS
ncbi:MAG: tRNA (adenosine(37)-N6)-threonylcarbamoyltransferase complex transferase subunit TsaD, partial [Candidatus Krumholzibacteria bacterium]|nr:tRNA (adenosine(37)-N6)-threonylcarbamoyltransferase complex transferase subunit TsaD [Candidatus Krumholzibacteria bacterium]